MSPGRAARRWIRAAYRALWWWARNGLPRSPWEPGHWWTPWWPRRSRTRRRSWAGVSPRRRPRRSLPRTPPRRRARLAAPCRSSRRGRRLALWPASGGRAGPATLPPFPYPAAMMPPSMASMAPLMNAASSESRNAAALATSSGVPLRLSGICFVRSSYCSGVTKPSVAGVGTLPGAMALTRMPRGPSSPASTLVSPAMPCLAAT